jgi:TusA-related sulfurtransferase
MEKIEQIKALKSGDVIEIKTRYNGVAKIKIEKITKKMVYYRWVQLWQEDGVSGYVMKNTHEYIAQKAA